MCACECCDQGAQTKSSDSPRDGVTEDQKAINHLTWVLGEKLRSSSGTVFILNN